MKKKVIIRILFLSGIIFSISNCQTNDRSWGEENAIRQCGTCHLTPDPKSLTKEIWEQSILPEMSKYFKWNSKSKYEYAMIHFTEKKGTLPMNDKTWNSISSYYLDNSDLTVDTIRKNLPIQKQFKEVIIDDVSNSPNLTAIEIDPSTGKVYCAPKNQIVSIEKDYKIDTLLTSDITVTDIALSSNDQVYFLDVGLLNPNDFAAGSLHRYDLKASTDNTLKSTLRRPVHLLQDGDKIYISEHGNNIGKFSEYDTQTRQSEELVPLPGVYKTFVVDLDKDGQQEILLQVGQAKEGIYIWSESKPLEALIEFPSEFGLSDLDTADMNNDGFVDLVVTNGDNADYSYQLKNYHGVRVYLNDGSGNFEESFFYQMYGASQVRCLEANSDGKMDMVVSSFFPLQIDQSIIYLEQKKEGLDFEPSTFEHSSDGRWLVMDAGDIDGDGDIDLALGSFINGPTVMPGMIIDKWIKESIDVVYLINQ